MFAALALAAILTCPPNTVPGWEGPNGTPTSCVNNCPYPGQTAEECHAPVPTQPVPPPVQRPVPSPTAPHPVPVPTAPPTGKSNDSDNGKLPESDRSVARTVVQLPVPPAPAAVLVSLSYFHEWGF